ncbi:MAG: dipeptide epimerase [Bacteroidetes bacterium]|nr:MAG: dipeptide epimerase [Bacteroidota bacterium]
MTITRINIYRLSIPMVPFTIATGTMNFAQNLYLEIHTSSGLVGVGECSAFPMIVGETQDTCFALAQNFAQLWKGKNAADIEARLAELDLFVAQNHTVKSAFDMALYDLAAKQQNLPLFAYLGGQYFEPESDLTVGINSPKVMAEQALDFVTNKQATILKIKVGKDPETDIERVAAIRQAVGNRVALRIDANQGWDFEQAVLALTEMEPLDVQFCEQPMHKRLDYKMPSLRRICNIPLMADESVFDHHDAERLIKNHACDYINIKLSKAGGIREALRIHQVCSAAQMPNMLGGMLESRLALSAKVHMALACPNIKFYDLDTCLLGHKVDSVLNGVQFEGMRLKTNANLPGIGASIDPAFLNTCQSVSIA